MILSFGREPPALPAGVPARFDELDKVRVGDVVDVHLERGYVNLVLVEFVVPAEDDAVTPCAERRRGGRNSDSTSSVFVASAFRRKDTRRSSACRRKPH